MPGLERHWYRSSLLSQLLAPLGWLYCLIATLRRRLYAAGVFASVRLPVPVVVVGNITVGGAGKTPLVIYLARLFRSQGYRPGIVTRGYRGRASRWPQDVTPDSDPWLVGDEPLLLARHSACPVVADPDRVRAARRLVDTRACDLVLADDGLQHYRLRRDLEVAVLDATRRLGNGRCLPAGPLREPARRLASVTARVANGAAGAGEFGMNLVARGFHALDSDRVWPLDQFQGCRAHAVAGIGNPERYFAELGRLGIEVIAHPFPDHHRFVASDLAFDDALPVLMTEKDAVKCRSFADARMAYLAVEAQADAGLGELLASKLKELPGGR